MDHYGVFKKISVKESWFGCNIQHLDDAQARCSVSLMHNMRLNVEIFPKQMLI